MLHYQGIFSNGIITFMLENYYFEFTGITLYLLIGLILIIASLGVYQLTKLIIGGAKKCYVMLKH